MTLGLSKSSLNIIRINDKQDSKKRKLNELMSDHNINNHFNSFDHQIHYNYDNQRYQMFCLHFNSFIINNLIQMTSFNHSYGSPSKRSRNAFMTSIDSNKSKIYFVVIFKSIIT
jgi:hypothetical protein